MHICRLSTIFFACSQEGSKYWTAKNGSSPAPHVLLCDLPRVGTEVVTVGDNPDRLGNEAQFTPLMDSFHRYRLPTLLVSVQPVTPIPKSRSHAQFDAYRSIVVDTKDRARRSSATSGTDPTAGRASGRPATWLKRSGNQGRAPRLCR